MTNKEEYNKIKDLDTTYKQLHENRKRLERDLECVKYQMEELKKEIKQKEKVSLSVINKSGFDFKNFKSLIYKLSKTENLKEIDKAKINCPSLLSGSDTIFLEINKSEISKEETLKQIKYLKG